jgi:hypothetical protein
LLLHLAVAGLAITAASSVRLHKAAEPTVTRVGGQPLVELSVTRQLKIWDQVKMIVNLFMLLKKVFDFGGKREVHFQTVVS